MMSGLMEWEIRVLIFLPSKKESVTGFKGKTKQTLNVASTTDSRAHNITQE